MLGKMIRHLLENHGINESHKTQKLIDNKSFVDAVNNLINLVQKEAEDEQEPS